MSAAVIGATGSCWTSEAGSERPEPKAQERI